MKLLLKISVLFLTLMAAAGVAHAGVILQDNSGGATQIKIVSPVGQSFTAEDSRVSFAFYLESFNPSFPNSALEFALFSGASPTAAPLLVQNIVVPDPTQNFKGYFDVDISSILLTVGQSYTMLVSAASPYWGIALQSSGNPYAGGTMVLGDGPRPDADIRFRVTPQNVPAPAIAGLMMIGLAGITWARRRKQA